MCVYTHVYIYTHTHGRAPIKTHYMYVAPETEKPSSALIASSRIYMRYIHIYAYTYTPETEKPSSALIASSRMCVGPPPVSGSEAAGGMVTRRPVADDSSARV